MNIPTSRTRLTFDDFCMLVKDGQKGDLIDGVIYMASPDNTDAGDLFSWLDTILYSFVEARDLGRVFGSRVAFKINEENSPEPDIAFVRKSRLHLVERRAVHGAPDLAIEIVSPDSVLRDHELKRRLYQTAGVTEYWIIDERDESVTLLRLGRGGEYRPVRPRKGILASKVIAGFWIRPEWVWQQPRPRTLDVIGQLLA
jgi:Uma2 family endonuclease